MTRRHPENGASDWNKNVQIDRERRAEKKDPRDFFTQKKWATKYREFQIDIIKMNEGVVGVACGIHGIEEKCI